MTKEKTHVPVEIWIDLDDYYHAQISHSGDHINRQEN